MIYLLSPSCILGIISCQPFTVDDKYKTPEEDQIKNILSNQKKQFEDTIKSLKADLLSVLKSSDEPKLKADPEPKMDAVRFKDEFKHGFGQTRVLGE